LNFGESLASDSLKTHSAAALFLRAEGVKGYPFLPLLLQRCKSVDLSQPALNKLEETLVGYGALSLGTITNAYGFNDADALHTDILRWLLALTYSRHVQVAACGIYGLGELHCLPVAAHERLTELVASERRPDDHGIITCRSIAFRVLAKTDRHSAKSFVDSHACEEYLQAIDHWISDYRRSNPDNLARCNEIEQESQWLR